jgi:hypothetical protein
MLRPMSTIGVSWPLIFGSLRSSSTRDCPKAWTTRGLFSHVAQLALYPKLWTLTPSEPGSLGSHYLGQKYSGFRLRHHVVLEPPPRPCTKSKSAMTAVVSSGSWTVFRRNSFLALEGGSLDFCPREIKVDNFLLKPEPGNLELVALVLPVPSLWPQPCRTGIGSRPDPGTGRNRART